MFDPRRISFITLGMLVTFVVVYQIFHPSDEDNGLEKSVETTTNKSTDDNGLEQQVVRDKQKQLKATFLEYPNICHAVHVLLYKPDPGSRERVAKGVIIDRITHLNQNPSITSYFFVLVLVVLLIVAAIDVSKNYKDSQAASRRYSLADYASNKRKLSKLSTMVRHNSCSAQSSNDTLHVDRPPLRKQSSAFHASLRDMASVNRRSSVAVLAAVQIMKNQQMHPSLRRQSTESHSGDDNDSPERRRVRMIHRH
jgi:hypothetical protein